MHPLTPRPASRTRIPEKPFSAGKSLPRPHTHTCACVYAQLDGGSHCVYGCVSVYLGKERHYRRLVVVDDASFAMKCPSLTLPLLLSTSHQTLSHTLFERNGHQFVADTSTRRLREEEDASREEFEAEARVSVWPVCLAGDLLTGGGLCMEMNGG